MQNNESVSYAISNLQHAIEDAQATIRAYDSKAEVLGILLTIAIGITNFTALKYVTHCAKLLLVASWGVSIVAIFALGLVLLPRKNLFKSIAFGSYTPKGTYFLTGIKSAPQNTVAELATQALATDWVHELTYENMKLSLIRDYKHWWFDFALKTAGVALLLIAVELVIGVF